MALLRIGFEAKVLSTGSARASTEILQTVDFGPGQSLGEGQAQTQVARK